MTAHTALATSAQEQQYNDILSALEKIQQHLNEAHALCGAIHGDIPQSEGRGEARKTDDSVISLVEERTRLIDLDSRHLLLRLRDIGNRLGQVK